MADNGALADTDLERGVAALYSCMGEGAAWLEPLIASANDAASFKYVLPEDWTGTIRTLRLDFPRTFPRHGLRARIDPSPWLYWPHAMRDGLCLFGPRQRPVSGTPEELVHDTLGRIRTLLDMVVPSADAKVRQDEFEAEITTYWDQQLQSSRQQLLLLRRPARAQPLYALTDKRPRRDLVHEPVWLADDAYPLERHGERMTGWKQSIKAPATPAFFLPLTTLPAVKLPAPSQVMSWLAPHVDDEARKALAAWDQDQGAQPVRWLILQLPNTEQPTLQALVLRSRGVKRERGKEYGSRSARRAPPINASALPPATLERAVVQTLDRETVHSRNTCSGAIRLANATVLMVGVGSLGSAVATLLARAGVGHLCLVDPDSLIDANLGRHVLSVDDLGRSKVHALREQLQRSIPTVEVSAHPDYVETVLADKPNVISQADLVIVTTADWPSELALWEVKARGAPWSMLQAWSEPNAQVGHALLAPDGAFDARSLFESDGWFRFSYSEWPQGGVRQLKGCGASYIPGGPVALSSISTMVAQAAIGALTWKKDTTWLTYVGSLRDIRAAGGEYRGPDLPADTGSVVLERGWPSSEDAA